MAPEAATGTVPQAALRLIREAKLTSLLSPSDAGLRRLEASGVTLQDGLLWVIFDNLPHVIAIDPDLTTPAEVVRLPGPAAGYEDVAHDDETGSRFVVIEAGRAADGIFRPQIDEFDRQWNRLHRQWVDLALPSRNKGLEGLTCVRRAGRRHLLAISERGAAVHVLTRQDDTWRVSELIPLPGNLAFGDHSGLSVRGDRIAVVSQESSALWVGRLDSHQWLLADAGQVYPFPRDDRGRIRYGTCEGVTWLDDDSVAVVSDRSKRRQPGRFREHGESVQIFAIPPTPD